MTGDRNFSPNYTEYNRICQPQRIPQPQPLVVLPQPQPIVILPPQGPRPQDRNIDPRNIVADPRARRAKTLANRLIYLHARAHSI